MEVKMKTILYKIGKRALLWGSLQLFKYVDKNKNNEIDKEEIELFIEDIRRILSEAKKRMR
jgi:hypothetical protein